MLDCCVETSTPFMEPRFAADQDVMSEAMAKVEGQYSPGTLEWGPRVQVKGLYSINARFS
jgi:hypothetical protein